MRNRRRSFEDPTISIISILQERISKEMCEQFILIALCLVSYVHALNGTFVFDDLVAIKNNPDVVKSPVNYSAIFQHDFWGQPLKDVDSHKSYRPLTTLMFHFEYGLGLRARHMKMINLFLHCVNTLLLWHLFRSLKFKQEATVACVLFAVHPIHTEAVCGVVGRAELMFCLIYILALQLTQLRKHLKLLSDFLVIALTCVGILFKETAIVIPLSCVFLDYLCKNIYTKPLKLQFRLLLNKRYIRYGIATMALIFIRLSLQNFQSPKFKPMDNPISFSNDLQTKILSQNFLYVINLWILFCPIWLCFDWAIGCIELITNFWDYRLQSVFVLYTFIIIAAIKFKANFGILLGVGMLVIPFLPASGIIRVGFVIAERLLYVPSIGFCFLIAYSFVHVINKIKRRSIIVVLKGCLLLILLCYILRTRERATEWLNQDTLFSSALEVCPNNAKVHFNIAHIASNRKEQKKAMYHYHKAVELYPQYEAALMNLGNMYREIGRLTIAESYIKAALEAMPEFPAAWMNLGIVQSAQNNFSAALISYKNALKYRKNYAICHFNLGNLYLETKNFKEAMNHWKEAIEINPRQAKAWSNILTLLDERGALTDTVRISEEALKYVPNDTSIMFLRANALGKLEDYVQAEMLFKKVIERHPNNHIYYTNLGVLYHRWGQVDSAIHTYQLAMKYNSEIDQTVKDNLAKLLKEKLQGQLDAKEPE